MRPIDADALLENAKKFFVGDYNFVVGYAVPVGIIGSAPTINPEDLRAKGRWEMANNRRKSYIRRCSACKKEACFCGTGCAYKYCPNCGTPME